MRTTRRMMKWGSVAAVLVLAGIGAVTVLDELLSSARGTVVPGVEVPVYAEQPMVVSSYDDHGLVYSPAPRFIGWAEGLVVGGLVAVPLAAILLAAVLLCRRRGQARCIGQEGEAPIDELTLMRDLHASLGRMEQRIEALETILLDRSSRPTSSRL